MGVKPGDIINLHLLFVPERLIVTDEQAGSAAGSRHFSGGRPDLTFGSTLEFNLTGQLVSRGDQK